MDPERWHRIKEVFSAALELNPTERRAFLDVSCAGDPSLRTEVEALLATHEDASDFIEKPVYEAAAELFDQASPKSLVGRQLGPYLVIEEIGQGGMGIVYLAEDVRLGRRVAMKALAPQFTSQEQYRERLRREAIAAAALTHPGVATVHALEEFDGILYIVSEYVRGETLWAELSRGPMPAKLLLDTAVDLAQTLAATHKQGVIHRDLKPENVIRTAEGRVKILDFGLARIQEVGSAVLGPQKKLTHAGTFLGTPSYASPEQLRGLEVDFRTDIFSLGVMLYELTSGVHPFGRGDSISTITRILEKDPVDLAHLCPMSPPGLDRIIRRCLNKDPAGRYSRTRDLAVDLERLRLESEAAEPQKASSPAPPRGTESSQVRGPSATWWWQFHQVFVGLGYYGMLYPLWKVREWTAGSWGSLIFFASFVAVGIAGNLRLHLWFTSRFYPAELPGQRRRVTRWLRRADVLFVLLLGIGALAIHDSHPFWAALLLGVAIASLVSLWTIEPATTRAAFGDDPESGGEFP